VRQGMAMGYDLWMQEIFRFSGRRELGCTGFVATRIGCGDLADRAVPLEQCVATLRRGLATGINVVDTAPFYENGYSEEIVGRTLAEMGMARGAAREKTFVIDKVDELDKPVMGQVEASLGRLGLTHVDLFVMHELSAMEGPKGWRAAAGPGGSMEQLAEVVRAGKARFRGISSHSPEVLAAAIPSGLCDVVMFPVGAFVDARYVEEILPLARRHGVGTVCFKTFGAGKLLGDTEGYQQPLSNRPRGKVSSGGADGGDATLPRMTVEECVHYTLTLDPDVALLGMSFPNEQDTAFAAVRGFGGPLPLERMLDIRRRAEVAIAGKGKCWWNPSTNSEH
jgi:aryl-alcohol dehydrogenase-like predicted oxidoreductase